VSCPQPGEVIELTALSAEGLRDCDIPVGVTFRLHYDEEPAMDPTPDSPEIVASSEPVSPPPAQAADLREASSPALEEGVSASMPIEGAPDLTQLEGLAGGNPALMLALAVLLIVGGGAGWKFWQRMSEQRHEQAMAKLAIDREMAGLQGAQPPPCQTATAKMQREIDALEKRLGKVERRASPALPADFDADDLIARVEKLEKAKAPTRASSARG
jgi:hypothetical protein